MAEQEPELEINDRTGLMMTGFLLLAIAARGDEKDMASAADCVSQLREYPEMVYGYWAETNEIKDVLEKAVQK